MIVLIDNYDSFTYNLYQLIGQFDHEIVVIRNDEKSVEDIKSLKPRAIIISPGPGRPEDAGICEELIQKCQKDFPMLGICLGHQAIIESFSGTVDYAPKLMHGKSSTITIDTTSPIFQGVSERTVVGRYHSLAGSENNWPDILQIIGRSDDGAIMAIKHQDYPIYGLQFHPESILTSEGERMIKNFLKETSYD